MLGRRPITVLALIGDVEMQVSMICSPCVGVLKGEAAGSVRKGLGNLVRRMTGLLSRVDLETRESKVKVRQALKWFVAKMANCKKLKPERPPDVDPPP
jgi:hypothetical protein